ncbi:MAG: ATP-dependent nuclease subunit, partial [Firmicutes bacterium]|nr:ATP-dependent nuclease subunit [Bacillota bacterium]
MAVRLLYGIQAAALRERCLREVFDWTGLWPDKRAIIIVPEQAKLDFEQAYLNQSGQAGLLMAEILSFRRLATRLSGEVGRTAGNMLQASGQAMVLYRLLQDHRSQLKAFANLADKPGFIRQIAAVLGDLKRCGIDAQTLSGLQEQVSDIALQHKVSDLATLLGEYGRALQSLGFSDPEDDLDALAVLLSQPLPLLNDRLEWLNQTSVWIIGFGELRNFTPQEYAVIDQLLRRCEQLTITVMAESLPGDELAVENGPDIFLPGRRTASQLIKRYHPAERLLIAPNWHQPNAELAELLGAPPANPAGLTASCTGPDPAGTTPGLISPDSFVRLVLTTAVEDQTAWLAGEIRRLVIEEHYRYRDISVAVCNPADDLPRLQATFTQYKIPLFLDQVRSLSGTALLRTILGLLDIAEKGWTRL